MSTGSLDGEDFVLGGCQAKARGVDFIILPKLFLAASSPEMGGRSQGGDADKSPKERKGKQGRSRSGREAILWMIYLPSEKTGYCRGISYQCSLSPKVLNQRKLPHSETRTGLVRTCSSPTFSIFKAQMKLLPDPVPALPRQPTPSSLWAPRYFSRPSSAAPLVRCF